MENTILKFNSIVHFLSVPQTGAIRRPTVIVSAGASCRSHIGSVRYLPDAVSTLDGTTRIGRHDSGYVNIHILNFTSERKFTRKHLLSTSRTRKIVG